MEFLDFLKYGAIGISLALAILSYRLLSKEQDKEGERPAILSMIKIYFMLTVFLSVLFSATEILTIVINPKEPESNKQINRIWENYCSDYPDSTVIQKTERISAQLAEARNNLEQLTEDYEECQEELSQFDKGFYQTLIKMNEALKQDPDGWINIAYETESKQQVTDLLNEIFRILDNNYTDLTGREIVDKWKSFKMSYSDNPNKFTLIESSDITVIVRRYIDTYGA